MKAGTSWFTVCFAVAACVFSWCVALGVSFFMPPPEGRWTELGQDALLFLLSAAVTVWAFWFVRKSGVRSGCAGACGARVEP